MTSSSLSKSAGVQSQSFLPKAAVDKRDAIGFAVLDDTVVFLSGSERYHSNSLKRRCVAFAISDIWAIQVFSFPNATEVTDFQTTDVSPFTGIVQAKNVDTLAPLSLIDHTPSLDRLVAQPADGIVVIAHAPQSAGFIPRVDEVHFSPRFRM